MECFLYSIIFCLIEIVEIGNNVEDKFWVNSFNFYIYISWILLDIRFYCYYYYFLFKTVNMMFPSFLLSVKRETKFLFVRHARPIDVLPPVR